MYYSRNIQEAAELAAKAKMTDQPSQRAMKAEELAQKFHESYERLAPQFNYSTRKASAKPWSEVPVNNRDLMTAVCKEIIDAEFPAYLEIREALRELLFRFKRVAADFSGEIDPADEERIKKAEAALAKARKIGAQP